MPIEIPFIHNFIYNTYKPYRIHYVNHIYVIRGQWQSKKGQNKSLKKGKHLKMHLKIPFLKRCK